MVLPRQLKVKFFPRYFVSSATQASPYATSYFDDPTEPITNLAIIAPQTVQVDAVAAHEFNDVGITSLRADQTPQSPSAQQLRQVLLRSVTHSVEA